MNKKVLIGITIIIGISITLLVINSGLISLSIPSNAIIIGYTGMCWQNVQVSYSYEVRFVSPTLCPQERYPDGCLGSVSCPYEDTPAWGSIKTACELGSCVNPCLDINDCGHFCVGNQYYSNGKCDNLDYLLRIYRPESYTDPKYAQIPQGCKNYQITTCGVCEQCNAEVGCVAISPCCGNGLCESGENYPNCQSDCANPCSQVNLNNYCLSNNQFITNIQCDQITGEVTYDLTNCNDGNLCTNDLCDPNLGCIYNTIILDCSPKCEQGIYFYNGLCDQTTGTCGYESSISCDYGCNSTTNLCNKEPIIPPEEPITQINPVIQFFINIINTIKNFFCNTFKLCF